LRTAGMRMRDVLHRKGIRLPHRPGGRPFFKRARGSGRAASRVYPTTRHIQSNFFHIILAGLYRFFPRLSQYLTKQTSFSPLLAHGAIRGITAPFSSRRRIVYLALGEQPPTYSRSLSRFPECHTRQCSPDQTVSDQQTGRDLYGAATAGGGSRSCSNLTEVPGRIFYFVLAVGRAPPVRAV
jgi:hypothetical protein